MREMTKVGLTACAALVLAVSCQLDAISPVGTPSTTTPLVVSPVAITVAESGYVPTLVQPYQGAGMTRVTIVGDSITALSADALHRQLDAWYLVSIDGRSGYTAEQQQPSLDEMIAMRPDVMVINLGTNDALKGTVAEVAISTLSAARGRLEAQGTTVVFVTLTTDTDNPAANNIAAAVNAWIRSQENVVDWDRAVATSIASGALLTSDSVHPTWPEGVSVLTSMIAAAVDQAAVTALPS